MSTPNDGGPAFPPFSLHLNSGMTLRDYFAAAAFMGYAANGYNAPVKMAYDAADAMLAERLSNSRAATVFPLRVRRWMEANNEQCNGYLASVGWILSGQSWRDLSQEKADSVVRKFRQFKRAVDGRADA